MYLNEQSTKIQLARIFYWLGIITLLVFFLDKFRGVIQPFILALLSWFLIKDLGDQIEKLKIRQKFLPHRFSRIMAFMIILVFIFFAIEILSINIELIASKLPEYNKKINTLLAQLNKFAIIENLIGRIQQQWVALDFQFYLSGMLGTLASVVENFFIIFIYVIFLLIEETIFSKKIKIIFSNKSHLIEINELIRRIEVSIHTYLSVKTVVSLITGILSYLILRLFKVDFAEFWAFIIFLMNFIPYLGSFIATLLPAIFAAFQFNSLLYFVWVFASIEAVQLLVGNFIEPKIMSKSLNLSPLVVILSLSFWGIIWGMLGMIIAIPITSIATIIMSEFKSTRTLALLFSANSDTADKAKRKS